MNPAIKFFRIGVASCGIAAGGDIPSKVAGNGLCHLFHIGRLVFPEQITKTGAIVDAADDPADLAFLRQSGKCFIYGQSICYIKKV